MVEVKADSGSGSQKSLPFVAVNILKAIQHPLRTFKMRLKRLLVSFEFVANILCTRAYETCVPYIGPVSLIRVITVLWHFKDLINPPVAYASRFCEATRGVTSGP